MASVYYMVFDCADPRALATFWATALSYEIYAPNEAAGEVELRDPTGEGPRLGFMKVPESKVVKNRVHLDLLPDTTLVEITDGEAYYVGPGHTPEIFPNTEIVEFSPTAELNATMEVVTKNMEATTD